MFHVVGAVVVSTAMSLLQHKHGDTQCIFTLQNTAKRTLWKKDIVLKKLLCVRFAVAQMKLIKRGPAKRVQ